jgi:hypothetical protein
MWCLIKADQLGASTKRCMGTHITRLPTPASIGIGVACAVTPISLGTAPQRAFLLRLEAAIIGGLLPFRLAMAMADKAAAQYSRHSIGTYL